MKEIKRLDEIDILKSIGIVLMIMGHIGFGGGFDFYIHSFHMPMFYIISGFLHKQSSLTFKKVCYKKAKGLLIPYIAFAFFHLAIFTLLHRHLELSALSSIFIFNTDGLPIAGALWFLTSLFFVDVIYYLIDKVNSSSIQGIIVVLITLAGFIIPNYTRLPWALDTAMIGVGLFALGKLGRQYILNSIFMTKISTGSFFILAGSVAALLNSYVNVRTGTYSNLILFFIAAVGITLGLYIYCRHLKYIDIFIIEELRFIGKNSIVYVCLNQLILMVPNKISVTYVISNTPILLVYKILVLILSLLILHLLTKILNQNLFKWILGR